MTAPARLEALYDGSVQEIILARPPANILDRELIRCIKGHLDHISKLSGVRLLVFKAEGKHFSFGASVAEHLPAQVDLMLPCSRRSSHYIYPPPQLFRGNAWGAQLSW